MTKEIEIKKNELVFEKEENTVGKGENAGDEHFLLFSVYEALFLAWLKLMSVW